MWATTLTVLGQVTSPSRDHLIVDTMVTESVSPAIFEIMGSKHIGITILIFPRHVISSITSLFNSSYAISYWCPIEPSLYLQLFLKYLYIGITHSVYSVDIEKFYCISNVLRISCYTNINMYLLT